MAHGVALATVRGQVVMVHTNVGLATAAIGAIIARADHVPIPLFSGWAPTLEAERFGARTVPTGWGQEMADQAALVREVCKGDHDLRFPEQVHEIADRAFALAHSVPRSPVYVALPRKLLFEALSAPELPPRMAPATPAARPGDIEAAADLIAGAEHPVILAHRGAGPDTAYAALEEMVERWVIPVGRCWALQLALTRDRPMTCGPGPGAPAGTGGCDRCAGCPGPVEPGRPWARPRGAGDPDRAGSAFHPDLGAPFPRRHVAGQGTGRERDGAPRSLASARPRRPG